MCKYGNMTGKPSPSLDEIKRAIRENDIQMLRLEYTDLLGINRGKLMPSAMVDEIFGEGIAFCLSSLSMSFDNSIVLSDYFPETNEDMKAVGCASTFTILPHCEHTALILGDLYFNGQPLLQAPREFLKNMIRKYRALGLEPVAASELEFFVYDKLADGGVKPYTNQPCTCYQANRRLDKKRFLYKLSNSFTKMGYEVLYMNHEYYPGQFELNWKHSKALNAADQSALFKYLSKDMAEEDDLMVTYMAKPKNAEGGSGCHFHLSLGDPETGENLCNDPKGDKGLSQVMLYFIGGLIKHAKGISVFMAPTVNCYKRYQPDSFAPVFIGWGYDNRSTYIRVPNERGKATRVELRAASAASNPYLALGAILAAGLDGIENKIVPPDAITTDLYHDTSQQTERLPDTLSGALAALEADEWMTQYAGRELIDAFGKLKRCEIEGYKKYVTDWEWDTYSYHI
ncbi:MAG: glutamine synthetase family protein [Oscillospiraceae bacterium]|jgi:glutamine synthetase|nr:glutamine synthetase family protein [Oscillospiraceae bacterium]